jgi:hypothetical protein
MSYVCKDGNIVLYLGLVVDLLCTVDLCLVCQFSERRKTCSTLANNSDVMFLVYFCIFWVQEFGPASEQNANATIVDSYVMCGVMALLSTSLRPFHLYVHSYYSILFFKRV